MAAKYEVGDRVKVTLEDAPRYGYILTYNDSADPVKYRVSVIGSGNIQDLAEDQIDKNIGGGGGGFIPGEDIILDGGDSAFSE